VNIFQNKGADMFKFISSLTKFAKLLFKSYPLPPSKKELNERAKAIAKNVCAAYSRGNISLQSGRYSSEQDLEQRRREVMSYNFGD
jgi:hypothetical protein